MNIIVEAKRTMRFHLQGYDEDTYFYLIEIYRENIYVISIENHICQLAAFNKNSHDYQQICSFLISTDVFHIDRMGVLWSGLSDEGIFSDLNPKGQGIFAIDLDSQKPLYTSLFTGRMYECWGLQSDHRNLYACYEDEDDTAIACYSFSEMNHQGSRPVVLSTPKRTSFTYEDARKEHLYEDKNYTYCDQLYVSKDKVFLANNHDGVIHAFLINGSSLDPIQVNINGVPEKQAVYRFSGDILYILAGQCIYICRLIKRRILGEFISGMLTRKEGCK